MSEQINPSLQNQAYSNTDYILRYLINNPDKIGTLYFMKYMFKEANFVIFYYIEHFAAEGDILTEMSLETALELGKYDWVNPKSILCKELGGQKVTFDYLKGLTQTNLSTTQDYAEVLKSAVLRRFQSIMNTPLKSEEEYETIFKKAKAVGSIQFGKELVETLVPLIDGTLPYVIFEGVRYCRTDCLNLVQAKLGQFLNILSPSEMEEYSKSIMDAFAKYKTSMYPSYVLNIGRKVTSDPEPGRVISLLADKKVGKTRFTIGENVLPVLMLGKNVLYLSGEMTKPQILTALLVKFIFIMSGKFIAEDICLKLLTCINSIRRDTLTAEEEEWYNSVREDVKMIVIMYEHELFHTDHYGKIIIRHISDKEDLSPVGISKYFVLEEYFPLINAELDKMSEKDRYALIVRDHVGFMQSSSGKSGTQTVTSYLQQAKAVAANKDRPFVYLIINHLATEVIKAIKEKGNLDGIEVRGHNSNEEGKTCDEQWVLYDKPGQRAEGLLMFVVKVDRFMDVEGIYKTNEFVMEVNRGICEFKLFGEQKAAYPRNKEEMKALIASRKIGGSE